jgi:two-component system sensor histidine kinase SenX3
MNLSRRRGTKAFFITLGVCLTVLAVVLNITWIQHNSGRFAMALIGFLLFAVLIAGVVLNTVFLVREVRRNERQDSFLNAVTHELKTPIASIRLYLDTLQRHPGDQAQRDKFYTIMRSDTDRLLATVETVLKAGALGQRQRVQQRVRLELHPLVADCIATVLLRHHLQPESITLAEIPGSVRLFVNANSEDLRTAILNLLDNAITITDTGLGLAPRELTRIFKRFYRAASNDQVKIKGTGLGLFLVRTIARQHGGDVRATSEGPGQGTTIILKLPLAIGNESA